MSLGGGGAVSVTATYLTPWDFYIRKSGSNYIALRSSTGTSYTNSSLSTLINTTIPGLMDGAVIQFGPSTYAAPFSADATLKITSPRQVLRGLGPMITIIKLADNVDDSLIEEDSGEYFYDVSIENLTLDGNSPNQAAGSCLEWKPTDACTLVGTTYAYMLRLQNLHLRQGNDYALDFATSTGDNVICHFENIRAASNPVKLSRFFDSFWGGSFNLAGSVELTGTCASNHFSNMYVGGGTDYNLRIHTDPANYENESNLFTNWRLDNALRSGIRLEDEAMFNVFAGCHVSNLNQSTDDNTYSAISLIENAINNTFYGWIGFDQAPTADRWKYAIEEANNANYNKYYGILSGSVGAIPNEYGTALTSLGANSLNDMLNYP